MHIPSLYNRPPNNGATGLQSQNLQHTQTQMCWKEHSHDLRYWQLPKHLCEFDFQFERIRHMGIAQVKRTQYQCSSNDNVVPDLQNRCASAPFHLLWSKWHLGWIAMQGPAPQDGPNNPVWTRPKLKMLSQNASDIKRVTLKQSKFWPCEVISLVYGGRV